MPLPVLDPGFRVGWHRGCVRDFGKAVCGGSEEQAMREKADGMAGRVEVSNVGGRDWGLFASLFQLLKPPKPPIWRSAESSV